MNLKDKLNRVKNQMSEPSRKDRVEEMCKVILNSPYYIDDRYRLGAESLVKRAILIIDEIDEKV
jgi:hypothetical protein